MTEKIKVTLSLSTEAFLALDVLSTERKRSDFVSRLIVTALVEEQGSLAPGEIAMRLRRLADSMATM